MNHDDMPNYDEDAVQPMRDELTDVGFTELRTAEDVDAALGEKSGSTVVVINSVCGCAAGGARPGVSFALQNAKIPDRLVTVFAGQDKAAVRRVREHLSQFPPSSPFIAVLKDGAPVHVMQRTDIEGKDAGMVARELSAAFDANCSRTGPSIPPDAFAKLKSVQACGSSIPPHTVQIEGMNPGRPAPAAGGEKPAEGEGKKGFWKLFK
ncbi:MAG: BrxA/BrxB family bacilliredoxin [Planctomycetota bacterium JB042]